ncbi:MAG: hypothetical protein ABIS47_02245 [Acidimicrobiales bacterium]
MELKREPGCPPDASSLARRLLDQHLAIAAADDPRTGTSLLIDLEWFVAFALGIEVTKRLSSTTRGDPGRSPGSTVPTGGTYEPVGLTVEISGSINDLPSNITWEAAVEWSPGAALEGTTMVRVADQVGARIAEAAAEHRGPIHIAMRTENTNAFLTGMACWAQLRSRNLASDSTLGRLALLRYKDGRLDFSAVLNSQA